MSNPIREFIEKVNNDEDANEGLRELAKELEATEAELLASGVEEEQFEKALADGLKKLLASTLGGLDDNGDLDEDEAAFLAEQVVIVEEFFDEHDWHYSKSQHRPDVVLFEMGLVVEGVHTRLQVSVETNPRHVRLSCILPVLVEPAFAYPVCEYIAKKNYFKRYGCLKYDESDGELSYEYGMPINNGLDDELLARFVYLITSSAVEDYDTLRRLAVGRVKKKDSSNILSKINQLIEELADFED